MLQLRILPAVAALLLIGLAGCASDEFQHGITFDPLTAFPARATFAWDDAANSLPEDARLGALDLDAILKQVAAEQFGAKGYTEAKTGAGDYLLSYQIRVNTWIGAEASVAMGSLSLLLVEPASRRRVWTGFARSDVDVSLSRAERAQRLGAVMQTLLEEFPP
jgi:hypothetical protein